jgi:hypothetical protein
MGSDALWAWKSFLRGHNPFLYDLGIVSGVPPADPHAGAPSCESLEPARYALGDTRRTAARVDLAALEPRGDLTSTGFALARPGHEYLALQPARSDTSLAVSLEAGIYAARRFDVDHRREQDAEPVRVDEATTVTLASPFDAASSAVVHLTSTIPTTDLV